MKILLPTDGSRYALAAARALTTWFPRPGAAVDLLSVIPSAAKGGSLRFVTAREQRLEWKGRAGLWLDETAAPLKAHGYRVKRTVRTGNAAAVVVAEAEDTPYDLIVIGAKGRGDAPFYDVGSVALAVLEHAPAPVLMVRERSLRKRKGPTRLHPLRVLVASDGGVEADHALRQFLSLFGVEHAGVRVLTVADQGSGGALAAPDAWQVARRAAALVSGQGLPAKPEVASGRPADQILAAAEGADLLVLGSRGVLRTEERHLGSVALEVARGAPCSLLVVREGELREAVEEGGEVAQSVETPFEIAYRNVEASEAVEQRVLKGLAKLEALAPEVIRCRVTVEERNPRHRKGHLYHVSIELMLPGNDVVVTRTPTRRRQSESVATAIAEAFDKARRTLLETQRVQRGEVKAHEPEAHGRVSALFPDYGFVDASDARVIYFHRNAVLDAAFDGLEVGSEVRFSEEMGDQGPQATTVTMVGKHHLVP